MNLNVKVAALTSLGFIVGMCWLVSQVSTPIAALPISVSSEAARPSRSAAGNPAANAGQPQPPRTSTVSAVVVMDSGRRAESLQRPSPASEQLILRNHPAERIRVSVPPMERLSDEAPVLPPIHRASNESERSTVPVVAEVGPGAADAPKVNTGDSVIFVSRSGDRAGTEAAAPTGQRGPTLMAERDDSNEAKTSPLPPKTEIQSSPESADGTEHVVRKGESLARICQSHYGTKDAAVLAAVIKANPALEKRPNALTIGQKVRLPNLNESAPPAIVSAEPVRPTQSEGGSSKPATRGENGRSGGAGKSTASKQRPAGDKPATATRREAPGKGGKATAANNRRKEAPAKPATGSGVFDKGKPNIFSDESFTPVAVEGGGSAKPVRRAPEAKTKQREKPNPVKPGGRTGPMRDRGGDRMGGAIVKADEPRSAGRGGREKR